MLKKKKFGKLEIDLTGHQGNAFFLLGTAKQLAQRIGYTDTQIQDMLDNMKSSDYQNLINIFEENFGDFVILYV